MGLTNTQQQILKLLLNTKEQLSIRQIARTLKKSYTLTHHNIQKLHQQGIIDKKPVPPAQLITLSQSIPLRLMTDIERLRTNDFLLKHKWIDLYVKDVLRATQPFFAMLVFGSYAKGTQIQKSDLDLLIIVPTKEDIKEMEIASHQYTKIKKSTVIVSIADFTEMIKNTTALNIGNEAKKHHLILYGAEQYYQVLQK